MHEGEDGFANAKQFGSKRRETIRGTQLLLRGLVHRREARVQVIERPLQGRDDQTSLARIIFAVGEAIQRAGDFCARDLELKNHLVEIGVAILTEQTGLIAVGHIAMPLSEARFVSG